MSRNPLLYSDQSEVEDTNTIEPIEVKRSFIFYFIVLANSLLVVVVLLIIWSLFSKTPNTSFDQQLKTWSQQLFDTSPSNQVQTVAAPSTPVVKIDTQAEQAAAQKKELEQLKLEKERIEKELAFKAEQRELELQALKLKEEKDKAAAILESTNEANAVANSTTEEAAIIPNAAINTTETPSNTAKTQLEQILETMQNQN